MTANYKITDNLTFYQFVKNKKIAYEIKFGRCKADYSMSVPQYSQEYESYINDEERTRLIVAVKQNDVSSLKKLLNSSLCYNIKDNQGNNLLQIAAMWNNKEAFDFLLSVQDFPLNDINHRGETAVAMAVRRLFDGEYYATRLIRRGVCIHSLCDVANNSLLHFAISKEYMRIAQLLIENGANINIQNAHGRTPLHMCFCTNNADSINEGVSMLLYYGADPWICRTYEKNAMEDALDLYHIENITTTQEHLFYHVVDEYYELSLNFLFDLIENKSPFFHKMIGTVKQIVFSEDGMHCPVHCYINCIFTMDLEYLAVLVSKFDYIITEILRSCDHLKNYYFTATSIENFNLLLESHLMPDTIEFIGSIRIYQLVKQLYKHQICSEVITNLVHYLLTYGIEVYDEDLETVYEIFGYCQLFKVLLHQDIKKLTSYRNIMPALMYDVTLDIGTCLEDPDNYIVNVALLDYFAHPKLKDLCYASKGDMLMNKTKRLPEVPLLVEIARNASRQFLVEKFQIATSRQFYSLLKSLPISTIHEKIITLETKLYY